MLHRQADASTQPSVRCSGFVPVRVEGLECVSSGSEYEASAGQGCESDMSFESASCSDDMGMELMGRLGLECSLSACCGVLQHGEESEQAGKRN